IVLMASLSCRISPRTSTVIFFERSPLATAMVTSAMLRTCAVRFDAIELTFSVRSFHTPVTSRTCAWPPSLPSVPTSRATRVTSEVNTLSCLIMVLTMLAERRNSPCSGRPSTSRRTVCSKSPCDGADGASHFRGRPKQIVDEGVDRGLHLAPRPMRQVELHPLARLSFAAHDLTDALELLRHAFVGSHDLVEGVGDLAQEADLIAGHADREVAHAHGLQRIQEVVQLGRCAAIDAAIGHFSRHRTRRWTIGLELTNRLIVRLHGFLRRG